ncbi:uncharacterized protein B0T23DRAFT_376796 [Neurospora hispaniola]|uniref:Uncharacterized protein n=1 Tax=Neurospora hispaniola TaxID=588809 RepID=A0AAJ0MSG1_9PEZI|nr:hypothetical protein B0T23DRAFT_376796 [Neurospora hispaniola]
MLIHGSNNDQPRVFGCPRFDGCRHLMAVFDSPVQNYCLTLVGALSSPSQPHTQPPNLDVIWDKPTKKNPHLLEFHRDNVDCGGGDFCSDFSAAKRRRQYSRRSRLPHTPYLFVRRTPVSQSGCGQCLTLFPTWLFLRNSGQKPNRSESDRRPRPLPSPAAQRPRPRPELTPQRRYICMYVH